MENKAPLSTPSLTKLEETHEAKKMFFPFSPGGNEYRENQSVPVPCAMTTPKRRLSLTDMDDSMQSPLSLEGDTGYDDSLSSWFSDKSNDGLSLENNRPPLSELNTNSPLSTGKRIILQARRLKKKSLSLINEKIGDPSTSAFRVPSLSTIHSTRPSSMPSLAEMSSRDGTGRSWIKQISSPLEKMTLMSPTGQVVTGQDVFSFDSNSNSFPSQSIGSTHSLPLRLSSLTSTADSDGYFSEIDVFENEEMAYSTSDTIKTLLTAPISSSSSLTSKTQNLPCPTPIRPSRTNSSPQIHVPSTITKKPPLKRSSPSSELVQLHQPKRPPLPFFHCSNSQDSPITPPSPHTKQLKGRCLLRSQSYCMPLISGIGKAAPLSPKELIGDETMPYALPLVNGSLPGLKCVSPETLGRLIAGEFTDKIYYTIIDCRYPYEYEGGHIQGAVNIYDEDVLMKKFFTNPEHPKQGERTIYIFHCEFSSKRGPKMCRLLRDIDRKKNGLQFFPKLYYPELYLLEGGYKAFYPTFQELCEPKSYCPMEDENHKDDLRHFKQRAKSWGCDSILQAKRQVPSRCRRRTTVNFDSRPKSNSLSSIASSPRLNS